MNRYELRLKLQFLESFEISEVDNFSMDEVHSAAGSAYDLLKDFCKENNINLIEIVNITMMLAHHVDITAKSQLQ